MPDCGGLFVPKGVPRLTLAIGLSLSAMSAAVFGLIRWFLEIRPGPNIGAGMVAMLCVLGVIAGVLLAATGTSMMVVDRKSGPSSPPPR